MQKSANVSKSPKNSSSIPDSVASTKQSWCRDAPTTLGKPAPFYRCDESTIPKGMQTTPTQATNPTSIKPTSISQGRSQLPIWGIWLIWGAACLVFPGVFTYLAYQEYDDMNKTMLIVYGVLATLSCLVFTGAAIFFTVKAR